MGRPRRSSFQNAQRFVEIPDNKIDQPGAQALAQTIGIRTDAKRRCSRDAGRNNCGDPVCAPSGLQQELSAQGLSEVFTRQNGDGKVSIVNARQFRNGKHRRSYSATPCRRVT